MTTKKPLPQSSATKQKKKSWIHRCRKALALTSMHTLSAMLVLIALMAYGRLFSTVSKTTTTVNDEHPSLLQPPPPQQQQQQQQQQQRREQTTTNEQQAEEEEEDPVKQATIDKDSKDQEDDLTLLQECFPLNSKEWLQGPRHGNIRPEEDNADFLTDDWISNMMLFGHDTNNDKQLHNSLPESTILEQSMCHAQSRFFNITDSQTDERSIHLWIVRLAYLAMHQQQYQFAVPEFRHRRSLSPKCQQLAHQHAIGTLDYECRTGKFLIVAIENLGLGAVMRTTVLSGLLAALATNRTVLFVNHAPTPRAAPVLQQEWYHASCSRRDVQCFFHPPTPCVLTHAQFEAAPVLTGLKNTSKLFRNPDRLRRDVLDDTRSWIVPLKTITRRVPPNIHAILRNFTLDYRARLSPHDARQQVLEQAANYFTSAVHYDKVDQLISYGLVLYAMRPHWKSRQQLQNIQQQILDQKTYVPEATLGLPIRASDKCVEESECLSFEQYMRVMVQIWNRHHQNITMAMKQAAVDKVSIVLTTESASVLQDKDDFLANTSHVQKIIPFDFEFIMNDFDIQQDSGNPQNNLPEHNLDHVLDENKADQVMLSMISSLQLQLLSRYAIGNCCSNFHRLLFELMDAGCGAPYDRFAECLQWNQEAEFRICCLWDQSDECKAKNVKATIEQKWKSVRRKRMQERMRRRQDQGQEQEQELQNE